ncbi:hypothetical protein KQH42_12175 [Streptomyces sp. CHA1]|uniref:hypothetical protein n=1 Tax=Streptomyces TaxID=1883 RepID=UPI0003C2E0D2|nr:MULTISPECIES: hypothetical protein [Streptomyces]QOZ99742.1 hypothetical protein DI273_12190 [Streptomyces violascens]UYM24842.1 hypothetical protein NQP46_20590 [Streptomyces albus]WDV31732.1 hypothetical protein OIM90_11705 [Streptomyces sp. AD16]ESP99433.1 Hypothetical protein B591_11731 [Streptomyces sp. GBA 94-10 4N24]ESQ06427.1 Hypothetical protein B590_11815 [Streptomyces sp. PVA_94-07]
MRFRTAAASAALVLTAVLSATACSPEPEGRAECEGTAEQIPADCAVEPSFAETEAGEPADGAPATP